MIELINLLNNHMSPVVVKAEVLEGGITQQTDTLLLIWESQL